MTITVCEGWWHPNVKDGRVHDHTPGQPTTMHRLCEPIYTRRGRAVPAGEDRTETDVRSLAVEIVDMAHGYTMEFSGSPSGHEAEYDFAEERIARVVATQELIIRRLLGAWTPLHEQSRWRKYDKRAQPGPRGIDHVDREVSSPMSEQEIAVLTAIRGRADRGEAPAGYCVRCTRPTQRTIEIEDRYDLARLFFSCQEAHDPVPVSRG